MKYRHILAEVLSTVWAIQPDKLHTIMAFLRLKAEGGIVSSEEISALKKEQREPYLVETFSHSQNVLDPLLCEEGTCNCNEVLSALPSSSTRSRAGSVAVLPLSGTISHRMGMMSEISGGTSAERFSGWLKAALADPSVKAIVIDCDSPGGTVDGVPELGDQIYKGKAIKPIIGQVNATSASAAYWLLSQCSEIAVTPSGQVGSIGVFAAHEDISKAADMEGVKVSLVSAGKYKTEANPFEPLSADARQALQAKVDEYYGEFVNAVAKGRGVAANDVRAGFGEGRMVSAQQAVKQKMADRVSTMDQTLSRLGAKLPSKQAAAEALPPTSRMDKLRERTDPDGEREASLAAMTQEQASRARELEL